MLRPWPYKSDKAMRQYHTLTGNCVTCEERGANGKIFCAACYEAWQARDNVNQLILDWINDQRPRSFLCAGCDEPAGDDDYLCRECREVL